MVLFDIDEKKLQEVVGGLPELRALGRRCDVSNFDAVRSLVAAAVKRFGLLDVMVNTAGIASEGTAVDVRLEEWQATIDTNLTGVFYGCRAALPELLKGGGCIVNTASVSGLGSRPSRR